MSTTAGAEPEAHVVARFSSRLHSALDGLLEAPTWSMTAQEQRAVLVELARAEGRIRELRLRVLAAADRSDVAAESGASSTAAWLAHATRRVRSVARAAVRLALQLDGPCTLTREALARGVVGSGQARVIVAAVEALPESVDLPVRQQAEQHLIDLAAVHDEKALKMSGRRVLEVVDPDAADVEDGRRLVAEETAAARGAYLHMFDNGDGSHTGRFKIASLHAVMLRKMLEALIGARPPRHAGTSQAAPEPGTPPVTGRVASRPELMGDAFGELLERVPADRLHTAGGVSATVVVMLDYAQLLDGLGAAQLDTGEPVSAATARRLACEAGVIPVVYQRVLGGRSVVLDMGRTTRFHTKHQRIALNVERGGCSAVGCDRPAGWCHAHHRVPWAQGGGTSVEQGRLLCPFHHRRAHDDFYDTRDLPDGRLEFHRRDVPLHRRT